MGSEDHVDSLGTDDSKGFASCFIVTVYLGCIMDSSLVYYMDLVVPKVLLNCLDHIVGS